MFFLLLSYIGTVKMFRFVNVFSDRKMIQVGPSLGLRRGEKVKKFQEILLIIIGKGLIFKRRITILLILL